MMRAGRRSAGDRGDAGPLELVILVPVVLLLFGLVVAFGRATTAQQHVRHAAAVGARAAAGAQTAGGGTVLASRVVGDSLAAVGMTDCGPPSIAGTWTPGGRVTVTCDLRRRPRRPQPVRDDPRVADADRVGDRGHRSQPGWCRVSRRCAGRPRQRVAAGRDHGAGAADGRRAGARRRPPAAGPPRRRRRRRGGGTGRRRPDRGRAVRRARRSGARQHSSGGRARCRRAWPARCSSPATS